MSSRLVGSTTRAITRSRKTSSPTTSKPRLEYTPARTSYNSPEHVLSTRGRDTIRRDADGSTVSAKSAACAGGGTITAFENVGLMPRSKTP